MEGIPTNDQVPNNQEELSFDKKVSLAKAVFDAVNTRNNFTEMHGGFDDFAEVWQHVGDNRKVFDEMESAVTNARKEFDEKISDKKQFVEDLRNLGEVEVADMISSMFGISHQKENKPKGTIFSNIFKKGGKK